MEAHSLKSTIKATLIAGLIAAILVAGFHFIVTEPVTDRAINIESLQHQEEGSSHHEEGSSHHEEPLVSRDTQKVGLFVGFLLYGLTWALLFGAIYYVAQRRLLARRAPYRGLLLALLISWSAVFFPFLKYPANPPGVGEAATIEYRQALYLAFIALSMANTFVSFALYRYCSRPGAARRGRAFKWGIASAAFVTGAGALYLAMPANPDPVQMPPDVVRTFRILSLLGLALFWAVFAVGFAWFVRARSGVRRRAGRMAVSR